MKYDDYEYDEYEDDEDDFEYRTGGLYNKYHERTWKYYDFVKKAELWPIYTEYGEDKNTLEDLIDSEIINVGFIDIPIFKDTNTYLAIDYIKNNEKKRILFSRDISSYDSHYRVPLLEWFGSLEEKEDNIQPTISNNIIGGPEID
jgi:hypothetical protein